MRTLTSPGIAGLVLALIGPALAAADPPRERPNLLFLFTDDHAVSAMSCYGSKLVETPELDRLAQEGMLFENAFCGNSICAPSRATILTGLHSHANGHLDNRTTFDGSQRTFPKLLQEAGYQTAMVGKWHLRSDPTGFDHWQVLIGQGPYYNPPIKSEAGTERIPGYTTEVITDLGLAWLEEGRDPSRPFLLMLQHKAPHRNWQPGPAELPLIGERVFPEPATLFDDGAGRSSAFGVQEMTIARHLSKNDLKLNEPRGLDAEQLEAWNQVYGPIREAYEASPPEGDDLVRWKYQRYMQDYLACISGVDRQVGRVLDLLDELELADDTVVIYSSDQGFYLGEHGWYDKRWMYEESLRMPLIVRWPERIAAGVRNEALVQNIDYAPTFLDLAGIEVPGGMHGHSLVPLLRGDTPAGWRDSIYYHYYEYPAVHSVPRHFGVRTDRYKLMHFYQRGEWELFDLEEDPHELRSVHEHPDYAEVRTDLERELRRLQVHYGEAEPETTYDRVREAALRRRASDVEFKELLELRGTTAVAEAPNLSGRPFAVSMEATLEGPGGVLAAHGGESHGWVLEVREGRAAFVLREAGVAHELLGPALAHGAVRLGARVDADGRATLFVAGKAVTWGRASLLTQNPSEGLSIGRDTGTTVSTAPGERPWTGEVLSLRLAEGPVTDSWLNR